MAPPKDIARSYPKRGLTADVGFRSEPKFCGDGSVYFDGSSDSARTATSTDLAVGDTFTLTAWAWLKPNPSGASNYVLTVGDPSGSNTASIAVLGGAGKIYSWNGSTSMQSTIDCPTAQWLHIAVVIKPGAGNSQIFVDGVDVTLSHSVSFNVTSPSSSITIGDYFHTGANDWEGYIANACLFTESLTEDQVRQVMRASDYASHAAISTVEAFYPLSANFNDSTGSHNATLTGSVSFGVNRPQLPRGLDLTQKSAQARVYTGRGIDLDGSVDYLETTLDSALGSGFSVSLWFLKQATTGSNNYLWSSGSAGGGSFISLSCTSTNALATYDQSLFLTSSLTANLNQWHHAVLTVGTGANSYTVYLDGIGESLANTASPNITNGDFEIGRYSLGSTHYHDGLVSDVKVFDQVLTADQVKELYHYPEQVLPTGVSASNLIHRWALSDYNDTGGTGGRYFQDSAGNNALEDKGSANMAFAQPVPCPQLGLQQSASRIYWDDNTAEKLSATIPALGTDFTIAFWWFSGSSADSDVFLEVNTPGLYQFYDDGSQIIYYSSTAGTFNTGVSVPEGEWSHIGLTQNGVYKNGVLYTTTFSLDWLGTAYRIFGRHSAALACNGTCSNMAFWSDALTTAEMLELYNQGPDYDPRNDTGNYASSDTLQNLWFMDDLATVKDRKGSNDLTVIGSPIMQSFPENASGSTIVGDFSMKRKGVSVLNLGAVSNAANEYALSAKDSAFLPSFANGGAFSCFFRLQKLGEFSSIFINDDYGSGTQHRFAVYLNSANKVYFELGDGVSARANPNTTGTISDSDWHHFAFTVDYGGGSTTTIKLFLDGVLDSTSTATTLAGVPNATALRFGDYVTSGANEMNGPIACLKFYQVTLSENEIKQIYNSDLRLIKGLENE